MHAHVTLGQCVTGHTHTSRVVATAGGGARHSSASTQTATRDMVRPAKKCEGAFKWVPPG